jgi:hypothetical protein
MPYSLLAKPLSKRALTAISLALLTAMPSAAYAFAPNPQASTFGEMSAKQNLDSQQWLMADGDDDDDDDDDKKNRNRNRNQGRDRDDDDKKRVVRIDLNRAKNLARQAAESANGGIRYYRAEASMHGPAQNCPYVDNGDSWTFTFTGNSVGSQTKTIQSVVTVYKSTSRIVMAYNGPVRTAQQTQVSSFSTSQRTVLVDLLRGNCSCNNLLTSATRTQIVSQSRSLSPSMQKQLLRGKGLPPGIAKKLVRLPKQVNTHLNLPTSYDLVVVGSNVLLLDQVNYVVVDYISNVIL